MSENNTGSVRKTDVPNAGRLKNPYKNGKFVVREREKYPLLFAVAFFGMLISFLPSLIANKGIFLYYGDFNSQQVMFYYHAQDMVKSGNLGWDWGTDLGSDFLTSYSFYLSGSPFFWLTTLFPKGATVYLMPWLICLKTAVAAVTAYAYIRRFVENRNACFIGGMLYAFSGFQVYNVFFNHFHDATAFFPLLLLGLELLVQENKKGAFLLVVALNAITNYFFFISDCIFLVIYFLVRCCDNSFKITLKKVGIIAFESIVGVMIAAILFVPSCIAVLGNNRVKEHLYGQDMVIYGDPTRLPRIFQAFFMMSDMPARINIFDSDKARWASLAGYLPLFSMCGVIAYMRTKKKNWAGTLIKVCVVIACVPILNSMFVLFNASYYARWYYSPILIMCLMTAYVLDKDVGLLKKGFTPVCVMGLVFLAVGLLPKQNENGEAEFLKMPKYIEFYYIQAAVTILMIVALAIFIYVLTKKKGKTEILKIASVMTSAACIVYMTSSVLYGVAQGESNNMYIERAIKGGEKIDLKALDKQSENYNPDNCFYRIDTSPNVDNWCMFWGESSMRCFHSVVSPSIMEFYTEIGQTRDVASRIDTYLYPLRTLLGAKYYLDEGKVDKDSEYHNVLDGFKYKTTENGFNIYENENYVPMGFAFDNFVYEREFKKKPDIDQAKTLMKALVLDEQQAVEYADYIAPLNMDSADYSFTGYKLDCAARKTQSCSSFEYDSYGFRSKINLKNKKLVFFSVPYDKGWSAKVNGKEVPVIKVDYGFMAVPCEEGDNTIEFSYETYGIGAGKILTVTGLGVFAVYMGIICIVRKSKSKKEDEEPEFISRGISQKK